METRNPLRKGDVIDCEINHPQFGWIPFTAQDNTEDEFVQAVFDHWNKEDTPVAEPDIAAIKAEAERKIANWAEGFTQKFTALVPPAEVASWPTKSAAAEAHLSGQPQAMILAEAAVTGEDPDSLAAKIKAKSDLYSAVIATLAGVRRKAIAAVESAKNPEEVSLALSEALSMANSQAAKLGVA